MLRLIAIKPYFCGKMDMLARFQQFVRDEGLRRDNAPVLLAVSGGLDSVCMAGLFHLSGWPFAVAHCNFQLRGAESDGDAAFVAALAARWGVRFFSKTFDTQAEAEVSKTSIQVAARTLRYTWFETVRAQEGFQAVATAHHRDDVAETVVFNLLRGAGLRGLGGIAPRNEHIVRPLLCFEKQELAAFAATQGWTWREDSSNAHDDYTRNFIRHRLAPLFVEINPNWVETVSDNARLLRDTHANLSFWAQRHLSWQPSPEGQRLSKQVLALLPAPVPALFDLLQPYGFTPEQARQVVAHLGETGLSFSPEASPSLRLLVERDALVLTEQHGITAPSLSIQADDLMVRLPDGRTLFVMPQAPVPPFPDGKDAVLVDADLLQFPLTLRPWQPGDRFQPFGMVGTKKLQDFFTDLKCSSLEKEKAWVLLNGNDEVVWVLGYRMDGRYKIGSNTVKGLGVQCIS